MPFELSKPVAALMEFVYSKLLKKPPPLNRDQLQMLQEDNVGESQWTTDLFKLEQTPFLQGIETYLEQPSTRV